MKSGLISGRRWISPPPLMSPKRFSILILSTRLPGDLRPIRAALAPKALDSIPKRFRCYGLRIPAASAWS